MTKDEFKRETLYQATMLCVKRMRDEGILTQEEYEKCRERMIEKYNPVEGKIVSN